MAQIRAGMLREGGRGNENHIFHGNVFFKSHSPGLILVKQLKIRNKKVLIHPRPPGSSSV
jgi:hypothetical protein